MSVFIIRPFALQWSDPYNHISEIHSLLPHSIISSYFIKGWTQLRDIFLIRQPFCFAMKWPIWSYFKKLRTITALHNLRKRNENYKLICLPQPCHTKIGEPPWIVQHRHPLSVPSTFHVQLHTDTHMQQYFCQNIWKVNKHGNSDMKALQFKTIQHQLGNHNSETRKTTTHP